MKLRFIWVGKTRSAPAKEMILDYAGRVGHYARVEMVELRDRDIEKESEEILSRTASGSFIVVADERGRDMSSREFAELIEKHRLAGTRWMTFILGGHAGVSDRVRRQADLLLCLSPMTLTHEMARVVLMEQVYRAFTIIHDLPYQK
ncbi:MAG TPA: 23S rRNA (pseudouridine(1915)-N(3))-methyltransferase RlmH [Blastocatellia bacterium]